METAAAAVAEEGKSTLTVRVFPQFVPLVSEGDGARFLWGRSLVGNPFEPAQSERRHRAVTVDAKPKTANRKPVPHAHRTDHADQCPCYHVAGMMGQKHQPAAGDQNGIDHHRHPRPRPNRTDRECQRESRDSVSRWKAGIGFGSGEVREIEGVGFATHKRPSTSDDPFDDLAGEYGDQYGKKHKLQAKPKTEQ